MNNVYQKKYKPEITTIFKRFSEPDDFLRSLVLPAPVLKKLVFLPY